MKHRNTSENTQVSLPLITDNKRSLESFYANANLELVEVLLGLTRQSQVRIVFIHGSNGVGKSHLLNGVLSASTVPVCYLPLSVPGAGLQLLTEVDQPMLACFDDTHLIADDKQVERNLLGLYERIVSNNGWLVVSSEFAPSQTGFMIKDLVSRFSSGLVYRVKALSHDDKADAFIWSARRRGLELTQETVSWLLKRIDRETHNLFSLLDKIDRLALQSGERVTIPFLRKYNVIDGHV